MSDLFLQTRREQVSRNEVFLTSFVGLLWFDNNYTDIMEAKGVVEFADADAVSKLTVLPEGSHSTYKRRRFTSPRGRVELNKGIPTITVGLDCPDSMVEVIIKYMGLDKYHKIIDIRRNSFWDKKG